MKKIISLLLVAAALVLCLASCGASYKTTDQIKKAGKLIVFTEPGFAPYEFISDNKIVGVDVAIMQAVADKLGVELVVSDVAFDAICAAVKSGKADVGAAGITINDTRKESVDFSIPYSSTEQYVVVAKTNDDIKTLEDLNGKKVGVQQGTTSDLLVDGFIKDGTLEGITLTPYDSPAVAAASIGKIDAVVTDKLTAQIIESTNDNLKAFKLAKADGSDVGEVEEYGIAVAKGNESLLKLINETLTELLANGSIDKWVEEYTDLANKIGA